MPAISISASPPRPPGPDPFPISVDRYHRMIQAGILGEDDPVELLEARIVFKMPRNPRHAGTIMLLQKALQNGRTQRFLCAKPIRTDNFRQRARA